MFTISKNTSKPRKTKKLVTSLRSSPLGPLWAVAILTVVVVLGCSEKSDDITEESQVVILTVAMDEEPGELTVEHNLHLSQLTETHTKHLWGIFEDDKGNFYWQDNLIKQVHQYSPGGEYIRSFGNEGRGPGELTNLNSSTIWNNTLFLLDPISKSVHLYNSSTGEFQKTMDIRIQDSLSVFSWPERILAENDSSIMLIHRYDNFRFRVDSIPLHRFSMNGDLLGSDFFRYPLADAMEGKRGSGRFRSPAKFNANSEIKVLKSGGFVHSHASKPVFNFYEPDGTLRQSIALDLKPVKLTKEHIQYEIDNSHPMIDLASSVRNAEEIPEFWPYWNDFKIDSEDNLWVEINTDPPHDREWWVITQNGEWLSKITLDHNVTLQHVGKNQIYTSRSNNGVMEVDRYRFEY